MEAPVKELLAVALGGAFGAASRYLLALGAKAWLPPGFAWGTWVANVLGCLLFGLILEGPVRTGGLGPTARLAITTGFLGALTTFSTFGWETMQAWDRGLGPALLNVAANLAVGLFAVWLGATAGRAL